MKFPLTRTVILVLLLALGSMGCRATGPVHGAGPFLSHDVYFVLRDDSAETVAEFEQALLDLAEIPGVLDITVGSRAQEMQRDVNDRDFGVILRILFLDESAYQAYEIHPVHLALIETWEDRLAEVVVRDAWVRRP